MIGKSNNFKNQNNMKNFNSNSVNESNNLSTISTADEKKKVSGSCNLNMSNSNNNKRMKKNSAFGTKSAFDKALETFSEMMIEAIQNIQNDWRKPWFNNGGVSWARNINGREYNGMNALMLSFFCQKYGFTVPVFGTFDAIMALNFCEKDGKRTLRTGADGEKLPVMSVKKGEKGFPVTFTSFTVVRISDGSRIPYDDYRKMSEEQRKEYNVFPKLNVYTVFNIAQTNIKDVNESKYNEIISKGAKEMPVLNPDSCTFEPIDKMITNGTWIYPINPTRGDDAYFSISKKVIVVPLKEQFKSGESFYSNLLHEMAHSTGTEEYTDRLKPTSFGSSEYAKEELVAELTAALCASRYGMSKHIKEDSAPYLKSWLGSLKESPDFIKTVLIDVKKASYIITNKIEAAEIEGKTEE